MATIVIDREQCIGGGACVDVCPFAALSLEDGVAVVNEQCTLCRACLDVCPVNAISLPEPVSQAGTPDRASYRGVWVWVAVALAVGVAEAVAVGGAVGAGGWVGGRRQGRYRPAWSGGGGARSGSRGRGWA